MLSDQPSDLCGSLDSYKCSSAYWPSCASPVFIWASPIFFKQIGLPSCYTVILDPALLPHKFAPSWASQANNPARILFSLKFSCNQVISVQVISAPERSQYSKNMMHRFTCVWNQFQLHNSKRGVTALSLIAASNKWRHKIWCVSKIKHNYPITGSPVFLHLFIYF